MLKVIEVLCLPELGMWYLFAMFALLSSQIYCLVAQQEQHLPTLS